MAGKKLFVISLLFTLVLGGCNLTQENIPPAGGPGVLYTEAAQTVAAAGVVLPTQTLAPGNDSPAGTAIPGTTTPFVIPSFTPQSAENGSDEPCDQVKFIKDVTIPDEIDAAVAHIAAEGRGLWGLVNNAGVNVVGPLIEFEDEDFDCLFDVHVKGVFSVTQACAPLIIESRGRSV